MSAVRISSLAAAFALLALAAAAQTPAAPDQPRLMTGMEPGGAVQPVMDQSIFAHLLFNELEGAAAILSSAGRDKDGLAPITTNCGSSRRAP